MGLAFCGRLRMVLKREDYEQQQQQTGQGGYHIAESKEVNSRYQYWP